MCLQKMSAMDTNSKMKILSNDLIRRMLNTSEMMGLEERIKIVDEYSQKLLNSGYGLDQVRRIVIKGNSGRAGQVGGSYTGQLMRVVDREAEKSFWERVNGSKSRERRNAQYLMVAQLRTKHQYQKQQRTRVLEVRHKREARD